MRERERERDRARKSENPMVGQGKNPNRRITCELASQVLLVVPASSVPSSLRCSFFELSVTLNRWVFFLSFFLFNCALGLAWY